MPRHEWEFDDALLLTALGQGRRSLDLSELIASAGALNHDVLPADRAASVIGRLIASGLVEKDGQRFRLTTTGTRIFEKRRGGMFEQAGSVLVELRQTALVDGNPAFSGDEYDVAYEAYRERASRWLGR